jgi:aminoglycoside phosphotransferase (APT) family kinase protein
MRELFAVTSLRGLQDLVDPEIARATIHELLASGRPVPPFRCVPAYVRFKADQGCLVGYRLLAEEAPGDDTFRWVTVFALRPERARALYEKWLRLRPRGTELLEPLGLDPERGLLAALFPNDRVLRGLKRLLQPGTFKRAVQVALGPDFLAQRTLSKHASQFTIVRYKPERRCVIRYDGVLKSSAEARHERQRFYVRVLAPELWSRVIRARQDLESHAASDVRLPALLGYDEEFSLLVEEDLGVVTAEVMDHAVCERVGRALAVFHASRPPRILAGAPATGVDRSFARAKQAAEDLAQLDLGLGEQADRVIALLERARPVARAPVLLHGDFSAGQILVRREGIALLDLDRLRTGDAAEDLAWWASQAFVEGVLTERADDSEAQIVGLLQGYQTVSTCPDLVRLLWFRAASLLELAVTPFRRLDREFVAKGARILVEAERLLGLADVRWSFPAATISPGNILGHISTADHEALRRELSVLIKEPIESLEERGLSKLKHGKQPARILRTDLGTPVALLRGHHQNLGIPLGSVPFTWFDPAQDPALPGLKEFLGKEVSSLLARLDLPATARLNLVTYRPLWRAVLKITAGAEVLFAKCFDPSRFDHVLTVERAWRDACTRSRRPLVPALRTFDVERGVLLYELAPGRCLHDLIFANEQPSWREIGAALRAFFVMPVTGLKIHNPDDEIATIKKLAGFLRYENPDRAQRVEDELGALQPLPTGSHFVLHRDLHDKQIFIAPASIQFIDVETSALGDRELDIANLAEHAFLRGLQMGNSEAGRRMRKEVFELFPGLDRERLRFYRASTLLRLCVVYSMRAASLGVIESLLDEYHDVLRSRP